MAVGSVVAPFAVFNGSDGNPLNNATIYIGQPNLNPQTFPVNVFWDAAGLYPAVQPLRTIGGYFSRNGTPAKLYVTGNYSITVYDSAGRFVYNSPNEVNVEADVSNLISDLANTTDSTKGSALVGRVFRQVDTIAELRTLSKNGTPYAVVTEYYSGAGVINSLYKYDSTDTTTSDSGFLTIVNPTDGGRWKLKHADAYTLKMAGGREDGVTDDADAWDRLLAVSDGKEVRWSGVSMVGRPIVIPVNNLRMTADSKAATIKAMDSTNFEYTLSAVGKSKLELKGFTVDSNKSGRQSVLTTRTVSISLVGCTDSQLTQVIGSNAIGSASIPGIGISTAGDGFQVNTTNCTAMSCGVTGKAADGFFCSSSNSMNMGNVSIDCLDTGHVIESCSFTGGVGCVSIRCGVAGAITNATAQDKYGCYFSGLVGEDWASPVTGGIQIGVFGAGNLIDTKVDARIVGVASSIGPGVYVRRTGAGRIDGLELDVSVRNGSAQGVLVESAKMVSLKAKVVTPALACVQFQGDCTDCIVQTGSNLFGGTFGIIASNTSKILSEGVHIQSPSTWGIYAFDTSTITSLMNDIVNPGGSNYEGKDAGATLNRVTLIGGQLSLNSVVAGAPAAGLSSKAILVNGTGATAGVIGVSAS